MNRRLLPFLLMALSACAKHHGQPTETDPNVSDCMERVRVPFTGWLSPGGVDSADALFTQAGRGYQDLWPLTFEVTGSTAQVMAIQFINGLPVMDDDVFFNFSHGALTADSGVIAARPLVNDTTGHQSFAALRAAFFAHVSESLIYGGALNAKPPTPPNPATYADSCLQVVLGYVDSVSASGATVAGGKYLEKVWWVSPLYANYPKVCVADASGKAWGISIAIP